MNTNSNPNYFFEYYYILDKVTNKIPGILILCSNIDINRQMWDIVEINISQSDFESVIKQSFGIADTKEVTEITNNFFYERQATGGFKIATLHRTFSRDQKTYMKLEYKKDGFIALSKYNSISYPRKYWALFGSKIDFQKDSKELRKIGFTGKRSLSKLYRFIKVWKTPMFRIIN